MIKVSADSRSFESFLVHRQPSFPMSSSDGGMGELSGSLLYSTNTFHRAHPCELITSQSPHLLTVEEKASIYEFGRTQTFSL